MRALTASPAAPLSGPRSRPRARAWDVPEWGVRAGGVPAGGVAAPSPAPDPDLGSGPGPGLRYASPPRPPGARPAEPEGRRGLARGPGPERHRPRPNGRDRSPPRWRPRSEEHTSELQSRSDIVCRLLLEKKKNK